MANGWSLLVGLIVIVALSLAAWFFSPKGENQTNCFHGPATPSYRAQEGQYSTWFSTGVKNDATDVLPFRYRDRPGALALDGCHTSQLTTL
ncbi:V-type proton ATPase subunit e [Penicillium diatomitis]|uniref:V-type proton ATPase subunit e n=1 Tax=Penicillium diatomitis TaxID=2819901 RepID=A0A9W9X540_9EURO|nr:V-type proton ATPase subunit e [Penicillium diatomitis]KAJ5484053.1 V-type proton ATPase subunit e [Penicillium diatomitis]